MFDLRGTIHELLRTNPGTSTEEIAAKAAVSVPVDELRAVVEYLMPMLVGDMIRQRRSLNPVLGVGASHEPVTAPRKPSARKPQPSAKVASYQTYPWTLEMVRINGMDKQIGDCSYDDLLVAVAERQKQARQNTDAAARYQRVADAVKAYGATMVRDLPPAVLSELAGQ